MEFSASMSKLKNFNPIFEPIEENKSVPQRHFGRRNSERRTSNKPKLLTLDNIAKLRKLDNNSRLILREGDRRQQKRRNSSPSLLKTDEIVILRKK